MTFRLGFDRWYFGILGFLTRRTFRFILFRWCFDDFGLNLLIIWQSEG